MIFARKVPPKTADAIEPSKAGPADNAPTPHLADENPYKAPQTETERTAPKATYDPLAFQFKFERAVATFALVALAIILALLLLG